MTTGLFDIDVLVFRNNEEQAKSAGSRRRTILLQGKNPLHVAHAHLHSRTFHNDSL